MNIECDQETLDDLDHAFKFSDAILRHLTIRTDGPITESSPMMRQEERSSSVSSPISDTISDESESEEVSEESSASA